MRIVFNVPHLQSGKGGAERVAVELANRLASRGHQIAILCIDKKKPTSYPLAQGVELITTPAMQNEKGRTVAIRDCLAFKPTAYFFFYSNGLILDQYLIGAALGVPMGGQECTNPHRCIRNIAEELEIEVEEAATLRAAILSRLTGVRFTIDEYLDSLPAFIKPRVSVFKNSFPNIRPESPPNNLRDGNWILNVGGMGKRNKNGLALVRAMAIVAAKHPDWNALFVGSSANAPAAQRLSKALGVSGKIRIIDSVSNINPYYSAAKIHVITSHEEGCPNVVCEAMLHGLATVAYKDCAGVRQLVRDGYNGRLVGRTEDERELAEAIIGLIENEQTRAAYGRAAAEEAAVLFAPETIFTEWLRLLERVEAGAVQPETCDEAAELGFWLETFLAAKGRPVGLDTGAPLVSFIVPLFNKRDAIGATMDSMLACGYPNFEIIVVDDQSTDGSYEFVLGHYGEHPNVRIMRRECNGGLSAARNTGLEHATGSFIQFWDADDVYYPDVLGKLVASAVAGKSEIVTGLASRDGKILPAYKWAAENVLALKQPYCHLAFQAMSTCFKLYRRSFLDKHGIRFVDGLYMQDTELNLRAFALARSVSMTDLVIGEYVDAGGQDRGSKQVSEARMRSALDIYDYAKAFADSGRGITHSEFWQFIVLKFVFRFFLAKMMSPERFAQHFSAEVPRDAYLERFRTAIDQMAPGMKKLLASPEKNDLRWGVTFGLLALGEDKLADKMLALNGGDARLFETIAARLAGYLDMPKSDIVDHLRKVAGLKLVERV